MSSFEALPVLLVSAANEAVATEVINELVDNEVTKEYNQERQSADRVWRLINKYYSADVRVHLLTDDKHLDLEPTTVEAHIIHITHDEMGDDKACAMRRADASLGTWRCCAVRVLLTDGDGGDGLRDWVSGQQAELVWRGEAMPEEDEATGPFAATHGVRRARAALHAHAWPNLVRVGMRPPVSSATLPGSAESVDSAGSSESESGSAESVESAEERRAVEHAEAFVSALGALGGALGAEPRADALPPALRLRRAEDLLAAFCRALGLDPADL